MFTIPEFSLDRDAIYFHYPHYHHSEPAGAIRSGDWKLIEFFADHRSELYNLNWDISETKDWSAERPHLVAELQTKLREWRTTISAHMPTANPRYDPAKAHEWWSRRTRTPLDAK